MLVLDMVIPSEALTPGAEDRLLRALTDVLVLLEHDGRDAYETTAASNVWIIVHRPAKLYIAGAPAFPPRYLAALSGTDWKEDDARRAGLVHDVTELILASEERFFPRDPERISVAFLQTPFASCADVVEPHARV
jgi:hypothetical protein